MPEHYGGVVENLLWPLEQSLGDAWTDAYTILAETIQRAVTKA